MVLSFVAKFIAGILANRRPGEVAAAVAFGFLLALLPAANLLWPLLFLLTLLLKLNLGAELAALAVFRLLAPLADPLLDQLGFWLLTRDALAPLFAAVETVPLLAFTRFNNTIVAGGLLAGLALWLPVFFLSRSGVVLFRRRIQPRIANSKLVKALTKMPLVSRLVSAVQRAGEAYAAFG